MDGTHRHLVILEVGLYFSGYPKHKERPIKPAGHWFEQIEAFAAAWPGDVTLIRPSGEIRPLHGITRDMPIDLGRLPWAQRALQKVSLAGYNLFAAVGAQRMATALLHLNAESVHQPYTTRAIAQVLRQHPDAVVLVPTATASACESIVRYSDILEREGAPRPTIAFLWHESKLSFPQLPNERFGRQLQRWSRRTRHAKLLHYSFLESNVSQWSVGDHRLEWLPWPLTQYERFLKSAQPEIQESPLVYVYATRPEQGSDEVPSIVDQMRAELPDHYRYRVLTTKRGGGQPSAATASGTSNTLANHGLATNEISTTFKDLASYQASLEGVTVAVLPYRVAPYIGRGSAALANLMVRGIPVITSAGTGPGDFVEREGVGRTYTDQRQIPALVRAVIADRLTYQRAINAYVVRQDAAAKDFLQLAELPA
jgi:hypothetical protein